MKRFLAGPCGKLEADLWLPGGAEPTDAPPAPGAAAPHVPRAAAPHAPRAAAIVCHPHPRLGGTMDNTVVFRTARALRRAGCAVLRFNFRGVGESEGTSEGSDVEVEDARAALDFLAAEFPDVELWACGFSFGARTSAALAAGDDRVARVVLVALPSRAFDCGVVRSVRAPGLIVLAGDDEFGNLADLRERVPDLPAALEAVEIPDTDHFFRHRTPQLEERVHEYAVRALPCRS